jgi:hypothetical protein
MALITRRHFARQMAFAAALCGRPLWAIAESHRLFDADKQNGAPPDPQTIRKLASQIVGQVITPEAADYDAARSIFNRAFDRRPAVIVRCGSPSDVARSLDFAQAQNLPLAVRAGGHSRLGFGMCDGGVVIDLSAMKRAEVDIGKRVARAEAGALVRDLDTSTQHFGLATTSGGCPTVGIAGFTLGGGEGRLMEKYGAACDNLLSAQVVTVDGRQVEASPKSNPDLFWAIRGGGGNFGVVTCWSTSSIRSTRFCREPSPIRPDAFQISCRLSSGFLRGPLMKWTRLPSCCHPNMAEDSKSISAIAAIPEWGMTCSGRCVLSSRRMTASRSCPTWKLRRPVDFLQRRLRTSKQISFFENSAVLPLRQLQRRSTMRQPHARRSLCRCVGLLAV